MTNTSKSSPAPPGGSLERVDQQNQNIIQNEDIEKLLIKAVYGKDWKAAKQLLRVAMKNSSSIILATNKYIHAIWCDIVDIGSYLEYRIYYLMDRYIIEVDVTHDKHNKQTQILRATLHPLPSLATTQAQRGEKQ